MRRVRRRRRRERSGSERLGRSCCIIGDAHSTDALLSSTHAMLDSDSDNTMAEQSSRSYKKPLSSCH